jgi:hypothetical protein
MKTMQWVQPNGSSYGNKNAEFLGKPLRLSGKVMLKINKNLSIPVRATF